MSGAVGEGDFFALAERKLDWLQRRDGLIAGNIANSNTPGYAARDLLPFERTLDDATIAVRQTDPMHLAPAENPEVATDELGERAPDRNGISLDRQLTALAETQDQQSEVTTLYRRYTALVTTALGVGGSG